MTPPHPRGLRLLTSLTRAPVPNPPFGLRSWDPQASDVALLLDATGSDLNTVEALLPQVPMASTLPSGALLVIFGAAARGGPIWRRLLWGRAAPVARALRCTAMLARGYVDIGAGPDERGSASLAWGRAA